MPSAQLLQWSLWGLSLLAGVGAILALFKLRYAERFLPQWNELKELEAILPVRREELRQATEAIGKCRAEIGRLEAEVGALRILKAWNEANPAAAEEIAAKRRALEELKVDLAARHQEMAQVEQGLNVIKQEANRLNLEKDELTKATGTLRDQLAGLHGQKAELEMALRDLDDQRRQSETTLRTLKEQVAVTDAELTRLRAELDQVLREKREATAERDTANLEFTKLNAEVEGLKIQRDDYRRRIEELHKKYAQSGGVGDTDISKALEGLAQPALSFSFTGEAHWNETDALQRFADHLQDKGLLFPARVQLAFHTSLKTAQINPLVVLAGVSGTGKSALPMAYAEALGFNFLSLAVQPGWSGPQDLLGFYNYLERKYKATELARALAQMSPFSTRDLPDLNVKSRKDQMLLVLLDEMNLARIEYYFSDFLSRLEQRKGLNADDDQSRRSVSLLIDAGSLPAGQTPRSIFPDHNVLFVGTMNEDESTQSLSDKVVDRANVLRFGAPKKLQTQATQLVESSKLHLPWARWRDWCRPWAQGNFSAQCHQLDQLNKTLEGVNRPFGHRVYQAILDYLSNYPLQNRVNDAFADQIEQKIIPKLRGLDTQDPIAGRCISDVRNLIQGLGDTELLEAFDRARSGHLFEWFGVKRS